MIKDALLKYGITEYGIVNPYNISYKYSIEGVFHPLELMPDCKSIIVIVLPYGIYNPSHDQCKVYSIGVGTDYHRIHRRKLTKVAELLKLDIEGLEYKVVVDTDPLLDREIAYHGGIGWFGKNNMIINETYGSAVTIGYLMVNKEFEYDSTSVNLSRCGACTKCLEACPTSALSEYKLDKSKCISHLSQNELEDISSDLKGWLFGCDECIKACPYNDEFIINADCNVIDCEELSNMSNNAIKRKYGHRAFIWRGSKVLKKNAARINKISIRDEK